MFLLFYFLFITYLFYAFFLIEWIIDSVFFVFQNYYCYYNYTH